MLSKGLEKVVSNVLDIKIDRPVLRYLYNDNKALVATDTQRMLILDTVIVNTECLLMVKKVNKCNFSPNTIIEGYPAITEGFKYPNYEPIILNKADNTIEYINYNSDECNELICFIARVGLTFNVKFIQDLFVSKGDINITHLIYNKDSVKLPFMLEGNIDGVNFKYIIMPLKV